MFRQTITRLRALAPLFILALGFVAAGAQTARAQGATRLYVADYRNARVAVFDTKAIEPKRNYDQVEATPVWVQTGAQPFGVIASPDGRRVYTANYGSDNVTVIDTTAKPNPVALYNVEVGDGPYQLALSPDAALWGLPFQALLDAQNRYLIEERAVSYAPSLSVLREMSRVRRQAPATRGGATLLAVGYSGAEKGEAAQATLLGSNGTAPLPEAARQARELGRLYKAGESKVYVGEEASEDRVKRDVGRYRFVQFATHGRLDDANPMYSHVLLSPGADRAEDGMLEAWEMMNLDLHADMVVLSACDTARGRYSAGEGVIGMSWALFIAGSPTTVVSQWKVESSSTTELMLDFHRNLLATHASKSEALRRASLRLLRGPQDYRHPFYWAGFVIIGDAR